MSNELIIEILKQATKVLEAEIIEKQKILTETKATIAKYGRDKNWICCACGSSKTYTTDLGDEVCIHWLGK